MISCNLHFGLAVEQLVTGIRRPKLLLLFNQSKNARNAPRADTQKIAKRKIIHAVCVSIFTRTLNVRIFPVINTSDATKCYANAQWGDDVDGKVWQNFAKIHSRPLNTEQSSERKNVGF